MTLRDLSQALGELGVAAASRLLVYPLTWVVPRDRRLWVVIGREHGKFLDNAKHFFCWMHAERPAGDVAVFLTEHAQVVQALRSCGAAVLRYPGPRALWTLLRAGTIVIDSADPTQHGRVAFFRGARILQLWHGAPLKEIELALHNRRLARLSSVGRLLLNMQKAITGRYWRSDGLVSTSRYFAEHAFRRCFHARRVLATGYPRNDVLLDAVRARQPLTLLNVDIAALERMQEHRARGGRVLLYAPTFRADHQSPFDEGGVDLQRWSRFARQHDLLIALKLHPAMLGRYTAEQREAVIDISPASDVYPLMHEVDLLVTDYSSIFFDYLLLDRPVLFYAYDRERYVSQDRNLLFDYEALTPGPRLENFDALLQSIADTLDSHEDEQWATRRSEVRALTFDHADARASERIWHAMRDGQAR